jgi:hypothetical protein
LTIAVAVLLALFALLSAARWEDATAGFGGAGILALAFGLLGGRAAWIPGGTLLLGAAYATAVASFEPAFDGFSIAVAALLLLVAELGLWSVELAAPIRRDPRTLRRRATLVALLAAGAVGAAGIVALAASQEADGSLLLVGLGAGAAVAVVGLFARLSRPRG